MQITKEQIKIIHTLKSSLKLDDRAYRAILEGFRVVSSRDMDYRAADELIVLLKGRAMASGAWKPAQRHSEVGSRDGMASPAQMRKIEAMWMHVSNRPTTDEKRKALHHFLDRRFQVSRLEWLPQHYVGRVIRVLEIMVQQQRSKGVQDGQQDNRLPGGGDAGVRQEGPGDSDHLLGPDGQTDNGELHECHPGRGDHTDPERLNADSSL